MGERMKVRIYLIILLILCSTTTCKKRVVRDYPIKPVPLTSGFHVWRLI